MIKQITEEQLKKEPTITSVDFDGQWYFKVSDVSSFLNGEDLSEVQTITLPLNSGVAECALFDSIIKGRKKTELTEFDKKIKQALNFNPKKNK